MSRIIKLGKIEAYIDYPEDVVNTHWDLVEEKIKNNYGKGWRLPASYSGRTSLYKRFISRI